MVVFPVTYLSVFSVVNFIQHALTINDKLPRVIV